MKNHKMAVVCIVIFALICIGLYLYIYTLPSITGALTPTVIVEYGQLQISKDVDALIVRDEYPVFSQHSGDLAYYVEENTKTRKGIKVLDVLNSGRVTSYPCPQFGVVSFYYDGYEESLTPGGIETISSAAIMAVQAEPRSVRAETISKGAVAFKMVTSDVWYTVFTVAKEEAAQFTPGAGVTLVFEDGSVAAQVHSVYAPEIAEEATVVISTGKYYERFAEIRKTGVVVVTEDYKGLLIPNTAIGTEDGNPGVYVKKINGEYEFTRINITCDNGEYSCVTPDSFTEKDADGNSKIVQSVGIYDEILKNAEKKEQQ